MKAVVGILAILIASSPLEADAPRKSVKEGLQALNDLIGNWKGTGQPVARAAQERFWIEKITWSWQFKGNDAWFKADFADSKNFRSGELRYLPEKDLYQLTLVTPKKETQTFTGKLEKRVLTLEHQAAGEGQRLVVTLLHANRFLYRYEVKPPQKTLYSQQYKVGATNTAEPFAAGSSKPECIVSGGLGTMAVSYKGQTYYVCCSGCRDEFNENPEKYIAEAKKKKK